MSPGERQNYGHWLRDQRQRRGWSLRQVSTVIRIDEPYLRALEAGNIAVLPEPYIRAFLKTYATYLGLDPEEAARRLEAFLAEQDEQLEDVRAAIRDKEQRRPTTLPAGTPAPTALPTVPVTPAEGPPTRGGKATAAVILIVCAAVVYLAVRLTSVPNLSPAEMGPAPAPAETTSAVTDTVSAQAAVTDTGATPVPSFPPRLAAGRQLLEAEALVETWMLAVADGDTVISRLIPPGRTVRVPFQDTLVVRLGKTDGMILRLDGREIADLGPPGMVLSRLVLTREGVVTRRITYPPDQPPPA